MENPSHIRRQGASKRTRAFISEVWIKDWFDPHSSFLRLKSFWVPFLVILSIFLFLCFKISIETELKFDLLGWTVSGMYEWFKIPLWVLALLIPVIGLFNANHKSEQTKESMRLTGEQNRFANYFKHVEEFVKHCNWIQDQYKDFELKIFSRKYHAIIYAEAHDGSFTAYQKIIDGYQTDIKALIEIVRMIRKIRLDDPDGVRAEVINMNIFLKMRLNNMERYLKCKTSPVSGLDIGNGSLIVDLPEEGIKNINKFVFYHTILVSVLEFDPQIKNKAYTILTELTRHFSELRVNSTLTNLEKLRGAKTAEIVPSDEIITSTSPN
ncbi:MAG TPA: hypothetical protein VL995_13065 [Cellvibrio sp.]|nr:hypothetical protein [Cellvibrio sp.]